MIKLSIVIKAIGTIIICLTETQIVFIMETKLFSLVVANVMIFKDGWDGWIDI